MSAIVEHKDVTDPNIHEPKGASTASNGQVYVADGAGSGSFQNPSAVPGADHGALTGLADDDHPQYLNEARHDGLPSDNPHGVTAAQAGADPAGTAAAAVTAHEAAADPHTGYVQETLLDGLIATYLDRHQTDNATPANNNTAVFADFINQNFVLQHAATYKVTVQYFWSLNTGARDFLAQLLYDGAAALTEVHRQEPKDAAGAGPFGTNQRHSTAMTAFVTGTPASHQFQLQFACATAGDNAAIYSARLYVERWS